MLEADQGEVVRVKKRYFAMVTELGKHLGYQSKDEREYFKEEVKRALGNESIAMMTTYDEVRIKVEELHKMASETFDYLFNPGPDNGIVIFKDETDKS